ncbi:metallophosphoesterase family protein [Flavimarina sp. Hel_I_48]|uniref:metallophosphoesterase family protein n=1 Tax=Flavimarina sp. Hel_I_48 TaxID=1392488 RepID=UPI0004DECDBC|nr:metallophosphoesterase [Flavimarina sp. Hel_I_48]
MTRLFLLVSMFWLPVIYAQKSVNLKVAFVSDIHFQDNYAAYEDFEGLPIEGGSKMAKIRTMAAQLHSTRLFNENYFALRATLDAIAARGIKLVALPGDYTDDGQLIHVKGLAKILKEYTEKYDISFFITTGNHDPVGPFLTEAGKTDFLGKNGKNQPIFSKKGLHKEDFIRENPVVIETGLAKSGYKEIFGNLKDFGFFPQKRYLYWETPFSKYTEANYSFKKAKKAAKIDKRSYKIAENLQIPDASYLVEPVAGLWLLAIDGNSYILQEKDEEQSFSSASVGYNQTIDQKKHLFKWIESVAERARKNGKKLIAFSHYPAVDFNDNASAEIEGLLGENKWQLERVPEEKIAKTLANADVKLHVAGHMHINDTGLRTYENGDFIVNIQTPSLGAYIPAYKILTFKGSKELEVQTIPVTDVPRFDEFFPLYKMEHEFLTQNELPVWDNTILESKNYLEFTTAHLKNLVQLRFLPEDWPAEFQHFLIEKTGEELLAIAGTNTEDLNLKAKNSIAIKTSEKPLKSSKNTPFSSDFDSWTGFDMVFDFYRLRSADVLAKPYIGAQRLEQYRQLQEKVLKNQRLKNAPESSNAHKLWLFMSIFKKFMNGQPADHFKIDLDTGAVVPLEN